MKSKLLLRSGCLLAVAGVCVLLLPLQLALAGRSAPAGGPACQAGDIVITVGNNFYSPPTRSVLAGSTVCWDNQSGRTHTVTSDAPQFDSGSLATGAVFRFTFTQAGTFPYHCELHGLVMSGTVRVLPRHP